MSVRPPPSSNDGVPDTKRPRRSSGCDPDFFDADLDTFGVKGQTDASKEAPPQLSWRMDEKNSFSDWTIVVTRSSSDEAGSAPPPAKYRVHKTVLALGPRSSDYFSTLLRSPCELSESASNQSTITLADGAADAFPTMLDFMYDAQGDGGIDVTTENSVHLRHLSHYFRVRSLFVEVSKFIWEDLEPCNAPKYLTEATEYRDEKLARAACDLCAENVKDMDVTHLTCLSPQLFKSVLHSEKLSCDSKTLSTIVAAFCNEHVDDMCEGLLNDITERQLMPSIDPNAADCLLKCSVAFDKSDNPGMTPGENSLQDRCIEALSKNWQNGIAKPLREAQMTKEGEELAAAPKHREYLHSLQIRILEESLRLAE